MTTALTAMTVATSEAAESGEGISPYLVGGIVLGILLALLLAVTAIGGGREHS